LRQVLENDLSAPPFDLLWRAPWDKTARGFPVLCDTLSRFREATIPGATRRRRHALRGLVRAWLYHVGALGSASVEGVDTSARQVLSQYPRGVADRRRLARVLLFDGQSVRCLTGVYRGTFRRQATVNDLDAGDNA